MSSESLSSAATSDLQEDVLQRYVLQGDAKAVLDTYDVKGFMAKCVLNPDARWGTNVSLIKEIDCYIKYGIDRVRNAIRLREFITKHHLDLLEIPEKFLYHIPGRPTAFEDENYVVVAKRIEHIKTKYDFYTLNKHQTMQLYSLCIENNYYLFRHNYFITPRGTVAIVDTDSETIPQGDVAKEKKKRWLALGNRFELPAQGYMFAMEKQTYDHPITLFLSRECNKRPFHDDEGSGFLHEKVAELDRLRDKELADMDSKELYKLQKYGVRELAALYDHDIGELIKVLKGYKRYFAAIRNAKPKLEPQSGNSWVLW
jgi:hypothetical protein